jgi:hypothetical protein
VRRHADRLYAVVLSFVADADEAKDEVVRVARRGK